jgi:hypothetical protein
MRHLVIIILFLFVFIPVSRSQEKMDTLAEPGKVYLSLKNISFVKNNEYYNPIIEGYTLIGYFIQPAIVYSPSKNVRLKLGAHLLSYSGAEKISQKKLVFSTTYNFSQNTFLTLGTLNGSDKHRMLDPHFDNERLYNLFAEDGLQFVTKNKNLFSDTWLSWENFIFKGDSAREVFSFGESFRFNSDKISDFFTVEAPLQIQFKHFGGQISNYSQPVETFFNFAAGLRVNFDIAKERIGVAGIEYLQFMNNELTKKGETGVTRGYASWIKFHYNYKAIYFGSNYWISHNFYAPNGNPIYSSVSTRENYSVIPNRKIWTNSLYLTVKPFEYLEIFFGLDAYYDLNIKRMDTALALHLYFDKLIKLATLKNN